MPFKKGESGNLKGRPPGARDRRSTLRYGLLKEVPAILKTLAKAAKGGDIQSARLILERTLPALKSAAEPLTLPAAVTPAAQGRTVLEALALGEITPTEAQAIMTTVAAQARVVEVEELTQRVQALEQALSGQR